MSRRISRRTLLRGVLGGAVVSVGLPPLERFFDTHGTAYAAGGALPVRFGMFFWGNGVLPERWVPAGDGPEWELTDQLAPLADVKGDVTVVSGMNVKTPNVWPHMSGPSGFLTGIPLITEGDEATIPGPTVDQIIAAEIGGQTRFRSIEFGAAPDEGLSFLGRGIRNPAESSPHALFERIFGAGFRAPGEDAAIDPRIAVRRSILDAVMGHARDLKRDLGADDGVRLDQHLDAVRELELRLARLEDDPPDLAACIRPTPPDAAAYPDVDGRPQISARNRALCDLMLMALACDQTRVFSNWMTGHTNNVLFPGASRGHHQLTHDEVGDQPEVHQITVQIVEELAYMLRALRGVQEGACTLLDNCAVLATTDTSLGRNHSIDDYPILIAGEAGGALRKGIHYHSRTGENASRVMLSLMRSVGVLRAGFGEGDARATDGLTAIEA